jgi:hypothetical protein
VRQSDSTYAQPLPLAIIPLILSRQRILSAGFMTPRLPIKADTLPSGMMWLHETSTTASVFARKYGARVRLYSRSGNELTDRFRSVCACASLASQAASRGTFVSDHADLINISSVGTP